VINTSLLSVQEEIKVNVIREVRATSFAK